MRSITVSTIRRNFYKLTDSNGHIGNLTLTKLPKSYMAIFSHPSQTSDKTLFEFGNTRGEARSKMIARLNEKFKSNIV